MGCGVDFVWVVVFVEVLVEEDVWEQGVVGGVGDGCVLGEVCYVVCFEYVFDDQCLVCVGCCGFVQYCVSGICVDVGCVVGCYDFVVVEEVLYGGGCDCGVWLQCVGGDFVMGEFCCEVEGCYCYFEFCEGVVGVCIELFWGWVEGW